MRKLLIAAIAALALSGCISMIDDAYDDEARSNCDQHTRTAQRGDCYDRVERESRERRQQN
jgi:hypothetical protein